jgi:hypothetical protein
VGNQNSQKKSPRSSAKSSQNATEASQSPRRPVENFDDDQYIDHSFDHVARVREAKEQAQRAMESFGDISEYDVMIIYGQLKEQSAPASQPSLDFTDAEEKA